MELMRLALAFSSVLGLSTISRDSSEIFKPNVSMTLAGGVHWVNGGNFAAYHLTPTPKSRLAFCQDVVGRYRYKACFKILERGYSLGEEVPLVTFPCRCNGRRSKRYTHATILHEHNVSAVGEDLGSDWSKILRAKLPKNKMDAQGVCMDFKTKGLGKHLWFRPILYTITAELISTGLENGEPVKKLASTEAYTTLALANGGVDGVFGQSLSQEYGYYTPIKE